MSDRLETGDSRESGAHARGRSVTQAPAYDSLPSLKARMTRGGPEAQQISVGIEVVTPLLGGGTRTRALDNVEVIRPATIRGHQAPRCPSLHRKKGDVNA